MDHRIDATLGSLAYTNNDRGDGRMRGPLKRGDRSRPFHTTDDGSSSASSNTNSQFAKVER